jgi:hypothetical protein
MGSTMNTKQKHFKTAIQRTILMLTAAGSLMVLATSQAQAGNVGWAVSVGGGYGNGYGGGWRPAAYGPGWGGWGPGWRGGYYGAGYGYPYAAGFYSPPVVYAAPPVVTYTTPPQPMVLAAQPQAPVWYFCEASGQYYPYAQSCPSGWQTQPALPPSSTTNNAAPRRTQN